MNYYVLCRPQEMVQVVDSGRSCTVCHHCHVNCTKSSRQPSQRCTSPRRPHTVLCVFSMRTWSSTLCEYVIFIIILQHQSLFTIHYLRWCMPPFMRRCWGLPHRLAQCTRPQGWGKLVNAALLSLINDSCVNVCCATRVTREAGRVGLVGRYRGRRGYWVAL